MGRGAGAQRERGSGLLATSLGLLFCLGFVLLLTTVAVHAYASSSVGLDARRAARHVAGDDVQRGGPAAVDAAMAAESARLTARYRAAAPEVHWSIDGDAVEVVVSVDAPGPGGELASLLGLGRITRHALVRREVVR